MKLAQLKKIRVNQPREICSPARRSV